MHFLQHDGCRPASLTFISGTRKVQGKGSVIHGLPFCLSSLLCAHSHPISHNPAVLSCAGERGQTLLPGAGTWHWEGEQGLFRFSFCLNGHKNIIF